jgi:hypothetical protein
MFKSILVSVLALSLLTPFKAIGHFFKHPASVQERVSDSLYRITGKAEVETFLGPMVMNYSCTGFQIAPNRIMTAAHCVGKDMTADGQSVQVVTANPYFDLALLKGKDHPMNFRPSLSFRDRGVDRFEHLLAFGYGFGWNKLSILDEKVFLTGYHVAEDGAIGFIVQGGYIGGMSGGPVTDDSGLVVGVVQRGNTQIGYSVGTTIIKAFLLDSDDDGVSTEFNKNFVGELEPVPFLQ